MKYWIIDMPVILEGLSNFHFYINQAFNAIIVQFAIFIRF